MRRIYHTEFSRWMHERGITPVEVAQAIGVTRSTVYAWAAGRWAPRLAQLIELAKFSNGELSTATFARAEVPDADAAT